jgi:hypothetical protein
MRLWFVVLFDFKKYCQNLSMNVVFEVHNKEQL